MQYICSNCGNHFQGNFCPNCGKPRIITPNQPNMQYRQVPPPLPYNTSSTMKQSVMGIISLIFSISGCMSIVGIIIAIVDLVINRKNEKHSCAIASLVVGIMWMLFAAIFVVSGTLSKPVTAIQEESTEISSFDVEESINENMDSIKDNVDEILNDDDVQNSYENYKERTEKNEDESESVVDTEAVFKESCTTLNYNDILRNPDTYKSVNCVLSGTVNQVIEGWFGSYTLYIEDADNNRWECTYSYKDGESHILEGDNVIVYGVCRGTQTSKTVLGKQVTLPYVDIEYIN